MQATYQNRTAGGILKTAKVELTRAGLAEVFVTLPDGEEAIAMIDGRENGWGEVIQGALVIRNVYGHIATLTLSDRALEKMQALESKAASMMPKSMYEEM